MVIGLMIGNVRSLSCSMRFSLAVFSCVMQVHAAEDCFPLHGGIGVRTAAAAAWEFTAFPGGCSIAGRSLSINSTCRCATIQSSHHGVRDSIYWSVHIHFKTVSTVRETGFSRNVFHKEIQWLSHHVMAQHAADVPIE